MEWTCQTMILKFGVYFFIIFDFALIMIIGKFLTPDKHGKKKV